MVYQKDDGSQIEKSEQVEKSQNFSIKHYELEEVRHHLPPISRQLRFNKARVPEASIGVNYSNFKAKPELDAIKDQYTTKIDKNIQTNQ